MIHTTLALTPGTRLGAYEITAAIGEGGMGQVYRARDTKLDRDVAIKILPQAFAQDADRLARFQREAKTLASLNHPHIAGIYGLDDSNSVRALVMELVEGDDLSQRIARGPIRLDDALPIAKQIAEALDDRGGSEQAARHSRGNRWRAEASVHEAWTVAWARNTTWPPTDASSSTRCWTTRRRRSRSSRTGSPRRRSSLAAGLPRHVWSRR